MRTLVVSDASPLNVLIRIGYGRLFEALFGQVIVPEEVFKELTHLRTPEIVRDCVSNAADWLTVRQPTRLLALEGLHAGERAAISLALELHASLLIDERDGRAMAKSHGIAIVGVVGLLEQAAALGLIADLRAVHVALRETDFRVSDAILAASLARHESRRRR